EGPRPRGRRRRRRRPGPARRTTDASGHLFLSRRGRTWGLLSHAALPLSRTNPAEAALPRAGPSGNRAPAWRTVRPRRGPAAARKEPTMPTRPPGAVCFVANDLAYLVRNGGVGTYFWLVANLLARDGWRAHLFFVNDAVEDQAALAAVRRKLADAGVGFTLLSELPQGPYSG